MGQHSKRIELSSLGEASIADKWREGIQASRIDDKIDGKIRRLLGGSYILS